MVAALETQTFFGLKSRKSGQFAVMSPNRQIRPGILVFETQDQAEDYRREVVGHRSIPRQQRKAALKDWKVVGVPNLIPDQRYCLVPPTLPDHTLFLRVSSAGAWRTTLPFQLALGGRHGVRSLAEDRFPGGRRVVATIEDRIRSPWPAWKSLELGGLLFADAGRTWAGDVPWGSDEGWKGSVGFGLILVTPAGSGQVWRPEIAFPVGHRGTPIFRVTGSFPSVRSVLSTPRFSESRRFWRGAEEY